MSRLILVLAFVLSSGWAFSQVPEGDGKISGVVIDSTNNQSVEFATIALNDPATGKPVNGSIADGKGKFVIKGVANGKYVVAISFIGYETIERNIEITDRRNDVNLGTVKISPSTEILNEVIVEGQKPLIEERVDRTIYNAENDATAKGGDATDVLRRVPMLTVDLDGNVSLRGSDNIKVLINNRPSTITASSVADALRQIPADQIKSVEVITSPSAKYDAEGTGGIINIVTKKNTLQGTTLNIDGSGGLRGSNLGVNGTYRKGKLGISLGGHGRSGYNIKGGFDNRQFTTRDDVELLTTQSAKTRSRNLFGNYTLGLDYDIDKKNFLSSSIRFGARNSNGYQDKLLSQSFEDGNLISTSLRDVTTSDLSGTVDLNLNYTHTFEKPQQEFSILTLYSRNNRTNNFENRVLDPSDFSLLERRKNDNESFNEETTVQIDYQTPIGNTQLIELGAKEIVRTVQSDYQYFSAVGEGDYQTDVNNQLTNVFNYRQNVASGYLAYTLNFSRTYSLKAGGRYEYTTIDSFFKDEQDIKIPSYGVFVPSINVSKRLENGNTVKVAFNRRVQRPSIEYLNPNIQASNPLNITIGNPDLNPEYTNNYEIGYSAGIKGTTLNFSAFMRNTNNSIQRVRDVVGQDTIRTTFQNIGKEDAYGGSVFASVNIGKKFTLNGGTDFYYAILNNNVPDPNYTAKNSGWVANVRGSGNYKLPKDWTIQFFGFYRGRRVQLQGSQGGFRVYSLNLQKSLPNKKGSIGFGAENFLTSSMRVNNELISPIINQSSTNIMHNTSFKVNFSYRIGKMTVNDAPRKRKKSVSNDDLKEGGDNSMQQDQGGQGTNLNQGNRTTPATETPTKTKKKKSGDIPPNN